MHEGVGGAEERGKGEERERGRDDKGEGGKVPTLVSSILQRGL